MSESNIGTISIQEILDKKYQFFIPSYQRGYRWTEQQVKDLLEDINSYDKSKDGKFYCLQPLVVCQNGDGQFNVIDGQQRLTTIYLILKELGKETFKLEYKRDKYIEEACTESFDTCKKQDYKEFWNDFVTRNSKLDKIEVYYLLNARFVIKDWLGKNNEKDRFREKLLNDVKFIWYPIPDKTKEHEYFKNLNSGKIPLTNAELIKAFFLNSASSNSADKEIAQSLIADEFDQMERTLRNDDFWYFLAGGKEKPSSCIELLFDLMLDSSEQKNQYKDKSYRTFFYFKDKNVAWEEVRRYFYILDGWYKNPVTYNLIGYLRSCRGKTFPLDDIFCLYNNNSKSKDDFVKKLYEECKESINYKDNGFMNLTYSDKEKIRNLLLFLNVATLLNNPKTKTKFQFADFHKENWDVEHISPRNPETDDILAFIKERYKEKAMPSIIEKILKSETSDKAKKADELIKKLFVSEDLLNTLANHTLLSAHTDRGIGNGFFFEKRQDLIEYYQQGYYIPPCSMNVFQKFYTYSPDNMDFWDEEDQKQYLNKIETVVTDFFKDGE